MINTHEKFLKTVMDTSYLYVRLADKGYKGAEENIISDLIYALAETTAYISNAQKVNADGNLTEEEYFQILINEMNINYL